MLLCLPMVVRVRIVTLPREHAAKPDLGQWMTAEVRLKIN